MLKHLILACLILGSATAYAADMDGMDMSGMDMGAKPGDAPSTQAFKSGMAAMDRGMGHYTGDTDRDFVINMIPHHQGAIDMAQVELKYSSDPALKKLATDIIAAQEKEIAFMKDWLAKHPAQ